MSRNYSFLAMLSLNHSRENIVSILENGAKMGCVYKDYEAENFESNIINTHFAAELVWSRFIQNYEYGPFIETQYYKTHFNISFYSRNNKIYLCIDPTHIAWKKRYDLCDWYGINFYRYQLFMLRLIGNNIITHFETYEYFDASYDAEDKEHDKRIYVKLYTYWAYDVYHHLKVNGSMLRITWLDANKQPINMKEEDNTLETIIYNEDTKQCWYGVYDNIILKFSLHEKNYFIIEPMNNPESSNAIDQEQTFNSGLRTTIELFKNTPVLRFITFQNDEDIQAINKMDE